MWAWTLVAAWMVLIFLLSAQPAEASSSLSGSILQVVGGALDAGVRALGGTGLSATARALLHVVVRKTAHFVVYLVLGGLTARALVVSQSAGEGHIVPGWGWRRTGVVAWLIATTYAATDEVHQLFVPGRGAQVTDVLLDSSGALVGAWLYLSWVERSHRRPVAFKESSPESA